MHHFLVDRDAGGSGKRHRARKALEQRRGPVLGEEAIDHRVDFRGRYPRAEYFGDAPMHFPDQQPGLAHLGHFPRRPKNLHDSSAPLPTPPRRGRKSRRPCPSRRCSSTVSSGHSIPRAAPSACDRPPAAGGSLPASRRPGRARPAAGTTPPPAPEAPRPRRAAFSSRPTCGRGPRPGRWSAGSRPEGIRRGNPAVRAVGR